ncbi:MAG: ATP-binding protein, partial [Bacteroidales bacterium]|nr:ATP-binding protein [Bacteroidales bacterium]
LSKNIEIVNDVPEDTEVHADEDTILTIIRNLISNAIKFTPNNGKIICSATKQQINKKMILISITDSGVGISEDKLNDLFTLGKEFSTYGTENEKGTGLGLMLCKELVELNGGKIWAESKQNEGSTFYFSLVANPS